MKFVNTLTGEELSHKEFVKFCFEEAERQLEECGEEYWYDLNMDEQIELYCEQYEHQLSDRDWNCIN